MNDRARKETKGEIPLARRLSRRPPAVPVPRPMSDEDDELASLATRIIAAEQAKKRAEDVAREALARANAAEARLSSAPPPAFEGTELFDLARAVAEIHLRLTAREASAARDLDELRALRHDLGKVAETIRRLAGGIPSSESRASKPTARSLPGAKRPR